MEKFVSANTQLSDYADKYPHLAMHREDGILQVTFHNGDGESRLFFETGGAPSPHGELTEAFYDISRDVETRAVILTGAGGAFFDEVDFGPMPEKVPAVGFIGTDHEVVRLVMNQINIPVPMIAAVDGPCNFFGHVVLLCDIAIGSPTASFRDGSHFRAGMVPGDGSHIVWPLVLGPGRGRYFLMTNQTIEADEAKRLGVVQEVVPAENLLARAWEIARDIVAKPPLTTRYTRLILTQDIKRRLMEDMTFGITGEFLAASEHFANGVQS